jgi:hypothetical protein
MEATQLYGSFTDWLNHEFQAHGQESIRAHVDGELPSNRGDVGDTLAVATGSLSTAPGRRCPLCRASFDTFQKAERHIANHLIRIALFSLPRSTDIEPDDDAQETDSKHNSSRVANEDSAEFSFTHSAVSFSSIPASADSPAVVPGGLFLSRPISAISSDAREFAYSMMGVQSDDGDDEPHLRPLERTPTSVFLNSIPTSTNSPAVVVNAVSDSRPGATSRYDTSESSGSIVIRRVEGDDGDDRPSPRRGKTRLPKRLVHTQVLFDLGYPHYEEVRENTKRWL